MTERHSKADYVSAAIDIVLHHGFDALTAKALGDQMGLDPSAMYRQFQNKDALMVAVFDRLAEDFSSDLPLATTPRGRIERQVLIVRNFFTKFPELAVVLSQATSIPHATLAAAEEIIDALKHLGYQGRDLVVAYQAIESMVIGIAVFETSGSPHHWEIRNTRYRTMGYDAFREVARGADTIASIANDAFALEFSSLLEAIERDAPANRK